MNKTKQTIAVGMSGGVDSSVAASLLLKKGYKVIGLTMKIWDGKPAKEDSGCHACYGPDEIFDIEDAKKVANSLNIDLHIIDLSKEYNKTVLDYFRREYLIGRTPNPCVVCNPKMKFGFLVDRALESGIKFEKFATGHYARIEFDETSKRYLLKRAKYLAKDQSYFIYSLNQKQLARTLFPLGNLSKQEVRKIALDMGLPAAERPESQDFVSDDIYASLFPDECSKPGPIKDMKGNTLGTHKGIIHYTIGQRRGLGISAMKRIHVVKIDAKTNTIYVSDKQDLLSKGLIASNLNWIAFDNLTKPISVHAKIRNKHQEAKALITPTSKDEVKVEFEEPQMSITSGQAVVFYTDDIVIGGGTIENKI